MTKADFYILAGQQIQDQWHFACRLAEQIGAKGHQVLLQVNSEKEAKALDDFLWSFRADAFVPHELLGNENKPDTNSQTKSDCNIHINWQPESGHHHDVLINLSTELPQFYSRFERLVEIVIQEDAILESTRQSYRFLKDRGYPIQHQDMRMR